MTNQGFMKIMEIIHNFLKTDANNKFDLYPIVEHAKKLVAVAEVSKKFMATKDTDDVWPHVYDALEASLKDLERE